MPSMDVTGAVTHTVNDSLPTTMPSSGNGSCSIIWCAISVIVHTVPSVSRSV